MYFIKSWLLTTTGFVVAVGTNYNVVTDLAKNVVESAHTNWDDAWGHAPAVRVNEVMG